MIPRQNGLSETQCMVCYETYHKLTINREITIAEEEENESLREEEAAEKFPIILIKCGHTLCSFCVEKWKIRETNNQVNIRAYQNHRAFGFGNNAIQRQVEDKFIIKCPICSTITNQKDLVKNYSLIGLIEELRVSKEKNTDIQIRTNSFSFNVVCREHREMISLISLTTSNTCCPKCKRTKDEMIPFEEFCKRRQQILLEVESKIEKMYFKEDSALEDMVNKKKKKINDLFEKAFSIIKKKDNIEEPEEKLIVENLFVYLEKLLNEKLQKFDKYSPLLSIINLRMKKYHKDIKMKMQIFKYLLEKVKNRKQERFVLESISNITIFVDFLIEQRNQYFTYFDANNDQKYFQDLYMEIECFVYNIGLTNFSDTINKKLDELRQILYIEDTTKEETITETN